jgi:iron complex outermembrane receptor protein
VFLVLFGLVLLKLPEVRADGTNLVIAAPSTVAKLSLEQLMDIEVTSVSKKAEKLGDAPAAVTVISQEDIQREGVTSIPEALRYVPGLDVGRIDAQTWAISARGFNDEFANKLLVLMDGRSVYTPLFSGVFWDVQDTVLEDIERIEVIRGPGASLWGANAVNGVINIMTKSAKDTQGWLVSGGGGTEDQAFGTVRYGGQLNDTVYYRVYGKYFLQDNSALPNGDDAHDRWNMERGGFRVDWDASPDNKLTFQGDLYGGGSDQAFTVPTASLPFAASVFDRQNVSGANVLGRWTHEFANASELTVQTYYDRTARDTTIFSEVRNTFDLDLQHHVAVGDRNDVVWGLGYRVTADDVKNTATVSLSPDARSLQLFSAFVQDEITLVRDRLRLTIGSKFEHNDFTGFEIQPSARLLWTPNHQNSFWASISRAVRTPSRVDEGVAINPPGAPPGFATIHGSDEFRSESLLAYEVGYRAQPAKKLSLDIAAFYNVYDSQRTAEPIGGPTAATVIDNGMDGDVYGVEPSVRWEVTNRWRVNAGYTYLRMHLFLDANSHDTTSVAAEGDNPQQQFFLTSMLDLPHNLQFDGTLRYVDSLPNQHVPSYTEMDLRLAWKPTKNIEFSVVGQNLLHNRHAEFTPTVIISQQTEVERSVSAKVTLWF